jgi:cell division protein FtsI/penicillin-binding protein 2
VKPFVVEGAGSEPGKPVFSPESLAAVRAGLEETVRTGTAKDSGLGRFRAAGKTGTAQISDPKRKHLYNAWFAAYAPADAPRIVVVAVVEGTPESGGTAAAPLVARFLEAWERERTEAPR